MNFRRIIELSLTRPIQIGPLEYAVQATLERTTDTSLYSPPSPDPAGLTYLPSSDTLLIGDSEVEERSSGPSAGLTVLGVFITSTAGLILIQLRFQRNASRLPLLMNFENLFG